MKILAILALIVATTAHAGYSEFNHDLGHSDFAAPVHIGLGASIAALATHYMPKKMNPYVKAFVGILAGTAAGCVSESLDKHWDNKDLAEWSIAGMIGSLVYQFNF